MSHKDRDARRAYNQQYYQNNSAYFKEYSRKQQQEIRQFLQQQKTFCKYCGNTDIRVLEFHHMDKSSKEINIAALARQGWGKDRILRELSKCEVICANCHRILHWEERNTG